MKYLAGYLASFGFYCQSTVIITGRSQETVDKAVKTPGSNAIGLVSNAGKLADILDLQKQINIHATKIDVLFVKMRPTYTAPKFQSMADYHQRAFQEKSGQ
jgi:hypothetical protein